MNYVFRIFIANQMLRYCIGDKQVKYVNYVPDRVVQFETIRCYAHNHLPKCIYDYFDADVVSKMSITGDLTSTANVIIGTDLSILSVDKRVEIGYDTGLCVLRVAIGDKYSFSVDDPVLRRLSIPVVKPVPVHVPSKIQIKLL